MTEPKFQVGQHVAVCTSDLCVVIPATIVTAYRWDEAGYFQGWGGCLKYLPAGWSYQVAAIQFNPRGKPHWFAEKTLRPINPNSEYLESPSHLEVPA